MVNTRAHVIISGRVQGVFFRASTRDKAQQLDLTGWVRNRSDGTVEAVFEGADSAVDEMITWCRTGPPTAKVTQMDVVYEDYKGTSRDFTIRY